MTHLAALGLLRSAIDQVDDGLIVLIAARRRLVRAIAAAKRHAGIAAADPQREHAVHERARRVAALLQVPAPTAQRMIDLVIDDARALQQLSLDRRQGDASNDTRRLAPMTLPSPTASSSATSWLRFLPPPSRFAPLLRAVPHAWQRHVLERAVAHVLAAPLSDGALDFLQGRRLGIAVTDLGLSWTLELRGQRLCASGAAAEATVRGSATDLLLLASRLEDADTLFFQRRLMLTGDTELGLTARNLLDRLPWESIPLALRIALNRAARFARSARAAHRGEI
jgi:predicted lipid carrier protein YhbT/chorismate mutase